MTGPIAIMLALGAQQKSVQALILPHRVNAIQSASKHLMDVTLMTYIHNESILGRVENTVKRDGQFHDSEVWSEMPACLRQDLDQHLTHFLGKLGQILFAQNLDV